MRGRGDSGRHPRTSRAHAAPFRRVEDAASGARALCSPGLRRLVPATRCGTQRPLPGPGSVPRFVHPEGSEPRPGGLGAPRGVSRVRLSRGRSAHSRAPAKGKTGAAGTPLSLPVRGSGCRPEAPAADHRGAPAGKQQGHPGNHSIAGQARNGVSLRSTPEKGAAPHGESPDRPRRAAWHVPRGPAVRTPPPGAGSRLSHSPLLSAPGTVEAQKRFTQRTEK